MEVKKETRKGRRKKERAGRTTEARKKRQI